MRYTGCKNSNLISLITLISLSRYGANSQTMIPISIKTVFFSVNGMRSCTGGGHQSLTRAQRSAAVHWVEEIEGKGRT